MTERNFQPKEEQELSQVEVPDFMRGNPKKKVTLRFNPDDLLATVEESREAGLPPTRLVCYTNYDPALNQQVKSDQKWVIIAREIEFQAEDGSWRPYPSVSRQDEAMFPEQLQTFAFVKKKGEESFDVMSSHQGVPDGTLMNAAQKAGIHTETI